MLHRRQPAFYSWANDCDCRELGIASLVVHARAKRQECTSLITLYYMTRHLGQLCMWFQMCVDLFSHHAVVTISTGNGLVWSQVRSSASIRNQNSSFSWQNFHLTGKLDAQRLPFVYQPLLICLFLSNEGLRLIKLGSRVNGRLQSSFQQSGE